MPQNEEKQKNEIIQNQIQIVFSTENERTHIHLNIYIYILMHRKIMIVDIVQMFTIYYVLC